MRYVNATTDFLGTKITVEVPAFESISEAVEELGETLALDRLNGRLAQDARQTPKQTYKDREAKGEDREDLIPEYLSDVRSFTWSATRGGGRDGTGLTQADQKRLGHEVAKIFAQEGRAPTPDELEEIRDTLGL